MVGEITPVILTWNEAENIGRTLARLDWAKEIVVVDSGSTDGTREILEGNRRVRLYTRPFDNHSAQWNYAIQQTGISTEWILALDADYVLTEALVKELQALRPEEQTMGYRCDFVYCIFGKPIRGSLYPPSVTLYRMGRGIYVQDGHTQKLAIDGEIGRLNGKILHDDRKPLSRWLEAQSRYMKLEADKLENGSVNLSMADRVRRTVFLGPIAAFLYVLFVKGVVLDGWAGMYYAVQRMLAEIILSLYLIRRRLGGDENARMGGM